MVVSFGMIFLPHGFSAGCELIVWALVGILAVGLWTILSREAARGACRRLVRRAAKHRRRGLPAGSAPTMELSTTRLRLIGFCGSYVGLSTERYPRLLGKLVPTGIDPAGVPKCSRQSPPNSALTQHRRPKAPSASPRTIPARCCVALQPGIAGGSPGLKPDVPPEMVVKLEERSAHVAFGVMAFAQGPPAPEHGLHEHRSGRLLCWCRVLASTTQEGFVDRAVGLQRQTLAGERFSHAG